MIKKLPWLSFFTLFLATSLLFSLLAGLFAGGGATIPTAVDQSSARPVIVLDAGHGGKDGGASGTTGVLEKELNLAVSKKLAVLFRLGGYTVVETRTDDRLLADADAKKGHVKQSDLDNRLKIAENEENCIFISLHMNTFPTVACRGLQVWYSQNNTASLELARAVQEGVKSKLQPDNNRKVKAATGSIFLLQQAQMPAILIECGFISTPDECARLENDAYQKQLALVIFAALKEKIESAPCENAPLVVY